MINCKATMDDGLLCVELSAPPSAKRRNGGTIRLNDMTDKERDWLAEALMELCIDILPPETLQSLTRWAAFTSQREAES